MIKVNQKKKEIQIFKIGAISAMDAKLNIYHLVNLKKSPMPPKKTPNMGSTQTKKQKILYQRLKTYSKSTFLKVSFSY
jgi:hypothetical protein